MFQGAGVRRYKKLIIQFSFTVVSTSLEVTKHFSESVLTVILYIFGFNKKFLGKKYHFQLSLNKISEENYI